jgi:hypothetical protein
MVAAGGGNTPAAAFAADVDAARAASAACPGVNC